MAALESGMQHWTAVRNDRPYRASACGSFRGPNVSRGGQPRGGPPATLVCTENLIRIDCDATVALSATHRLGPFRGPLSLFKVFTASRVCYGRLSVMRSDILHADEFAECHKVTRFRKTIDHPVTV